MSIRIKSVLFGKMRLFFKVYLKFDRYYRFLFFYLVCMSSHIFSISLLVIFSLSILSWCVPQNQDTSWGNVLWNESSSIPQNSGNIKIQSIVKDISYRTPSGTITTTFSLTIAGDKTLQTVSATTSGYDHHDRQYHERFNRGVTEIIGKKISDIHMDAIGWASITTDAFQDVLAAL